MRFSIRKFLLINLLLTLVLTTSLIGVGNYYLDKRDIQEHLDAAMALSALSYSALLESDPVKHNWPYMQTSVSLIPYKLKRYYDELSLELPIKTIYFQVWSQEGKLLLSSPGASTLPRPTRAGFSDVMYRGVLWRMFSTFNAASHLQTVLAERYQTRDRLVSLIARDDLYILLFAFPVSALMVWMIVGRGLNSLLRVEKELAHRAPNHLEPVTLDVPQEIKPLVGELNHLFERLQAGFEREKRFAADAAHELRTPLAALKTQVQVALQAKEMQDKERALKKLTAILERSIHIVQQLLTMSQLGPEAYGISQLLPVNLVKVAQEVLAMLFSKADTKKIELAFDYESNLPLIKADATALAILIRNLVDNAIQYAYEGGEVQVRAYQTAKEVVLEVADNGPGIPKALRERVFERFYRVVGSKPSGSGLGLAIVHQICVLHQARIELGEPKEGTGLVVRVYFLLR